jgi:hypothetical protein
LHETVFSNQKGGEESGEEVLTIQLIDNPAASGKDDDFRWETASDGPIFHLTSQ